MDEEEDKNLMDAVLGGFKEQSAVLEGLALDLARFRGEVRAFQGEMRLFKDETHAFQQEMRAFQGEMRAFQGEMRAFQGEMRLFKDETHAFQEEMRAFQEEMRAFRDETGGRLTILEEGLAGVREELQEGLAHLGERWLEHDRAIHSLKRNQA